MSKGKILGAAAFYPLTLVWLLGVFLAVTVSLGGVAVAPGLVILAFVALLLMQIVCRRELVIVHHLVNHQHDELVERVDQLIRTLQEADVKVPEPAKVNH
jgi:hypothetical protein